jgi:hypothetical protein
MSLNTKIHILTLTFAILTTAGISAQVSIGKTTDPRGVLDVSNTSGYSNTMGIVVPLATTIGEIVTDDGEAISGTIGYDLTNHCLRLKTENRGWTDCLLDEAGIKKVVNNILSVGADFKIRKASLGLQHTLAIGYDDNAVYVAGDNNDSRTGIGRTSGNCNTFMLMFAAPVADISGGNIHSACVDVLGQLWVWGSNDGYRTGLPDISTAPADLGNTGASATPVLVTYANGDPVFSDDPLNPRGKAIGVECGSFNTFVLTDKGEVWAVGSNANTNGYTGTGLSGTTATWTKLNFAGLATNDKIVQISASQNSCGALTELGKVYTWGEGSAYSLGSGGAGDVTTPTLRNFPLSDLISKIAIGYSASAAISADKKTLYVWGAANKCGYSTLMATPVIAPGFPGIYDPAVDTIVDVAVQRFTDGGIEVVTSRGVFGTGVNGSGQIGNGTATAVNTNWSPIITTGIVSGTQFTGVAKGAATTLLLTGENSSVSESSYVGYGMGAINFRQLGALNIQSRVPTQLTK